MKPHNVWWILEWNLPSLCSMSRLTKGNWAKQELLTNITQPFLALCWITKHYIYYMFVSFYYHQEPTNSITKLFAYMLYAYLNAYIMNVMVHCCTCWRIQADVLWRNIHQWSQQLFLFITWLPKLIIYIKIPWCELLAYSSIFEIEYLI